MLGEGGTDRDAKQSAISVQMCVVCGFGTRWYALVRVETVWYDRRDARGGLVRAKG